MTLVFYKSGLKHKDADCLSRMPVQSSAGDHEQDFPFLGAVNVSEMADYQRTDPELLLLIQYLESQHVKVPQVFARGLCSYVLRNNVLYKRNIEQTGETFLHVPSSLRAEILNACHDDKSAGHLGTGRTLRGFARNTTGRNYWIRYSTMSGHVKNVET